MSYVFTIQAKPGSAVRATAAEQLVAGDLMAYSLRANGTERHWELCPIGSERRETAEWIYDQAEVEGKSVAAIARELHISTATVRRLLEALELTEEIEAGEWDDLWAALLGFENQPSSEDDGFVGSEEAREALTN